MEPQIDNIRLPQQSRDQLIRMKRITGIAHWNVLCRWAFCLSLAEKVNPPRGKIPADSNIEMTWRTFAGEHADLYRALLLQRTHDEGRAIDRDNVNEVLRAHLVRGVTYLTARKDIGGIVDLLRIAM